jgi:o-succinylbenzoate synthase
MNDWELLPYNLALREPYRWAKGVSHTRVGAVVRCGRGWGEIALPPHEPFDAAWARDSVCQATGNGPRDAQLARIAASGVHPRIACGMSSAAWTDDADAPLGQMLAREYGRSSRPSVAVNALITSASPEAVARDAARLLAQGYTTFKLKIGGDWSTDLQRVAALRDAAPGAQIRLDANGAWGLSNAHTRLTQLAPFEIEYIEQPVPTYEALSLRSLRAADLIPIALDESSTDAATIATKLADGQGDVIIIKPQRVGGPDAAIACMEAARDGGAKAVVTNSLETSVGIHVTLHIASLLDADVACGLSTSRFLAQDVGPTPAANDGRMTVPTEPGLGMVPVMPK